MIITFCGHSDFVGTNEYENKILSILESIAGNEETELFLGEYGQFDSFAYKCALKFKQTHPNTSLVFITQYLDKIDGEKKKRYDKIIYPELEKVPKRLAILHRNKYMVEKADAIIAYVNRNYGGAYKSYALAKKRGKTIYRL